MTPEPSELALFWAGVVAISILVYVILDGFDLGIGILFGLTQDEDKRGQMMTSIAPFWDGNETWLVVIGASLFAAFPAVYAVFLGAFYLPVLLMLMGLIFRGVAFEFRERSQNMRRFWTVGFWLGSVLVAFVQGAAIGAMMRGVPVENMQFAGDAFFWLKPFPILTGIGLVFGYALLGAGWLVIKTKGPMQDWAYAYLPRLIFGVLLIISVAFMATLSIDNAAIAQSHFSERSWAWVFPVLAAASLLGVLVAARLRREHLPFALTVAFFISSFLTLGSMLWPYMIPYALTIADAAAPESSLQFFFYGGAIVLPVIAIYTIGVYWVFRGKIEWRQD
ncbi:cytochrome bd-I ubiquinol oxidase subunit 2 apoprotein [Pseudomonas pohangensis]|uniref:Cytochrome bd-I ubiquinol oxidase subunit 2 apoprotein n=1 Tax=Pseudomonas pohangensis TaxID=364197 RepID=A0A1H2EUE0_9PSED|nr:cytochrome d ubiquinol oxidase subunit II [Pseudomonas pohangensis]SDT98776.1 cytochrome bd-I ubiquinol oxidase subunit 2 apoprotein [Pseudomonas pohangensis]